MLFVLTEFKGFPKRENLMKPNPDKAKSFVRWGWKSESFRIFVEKDLRDEHLPNQGVFFCGCK